MNHLIPKIKENLLDIIGNMAKYPWLFAKNPEKDFIRKRKLEFEMIIFLLLSMDGSSLYKELLNYSEFSPDVTTSSAFVQQRGKILPDAFEFLFHEFNRSFTHFKTHKGYRLLAGDGSSLNIAHNPNDLSTYFQPKSDRELKYAIGLTSFHAKKMAYIIQEVFARLVMYNFSLMVTLNITIKQKVTKHLYEVNFTVAIQLCKKFIRCRIPPTHVEALVIKSILPVREDRQNQRKVKPQSVISFLYRVA